MLAHTILARYESQFNHYSIDCCKTSLSRSSAPITAVKNYDCELYHITVVYYTLYYNIILMYYMITLLDYVIIISKYINDVIISCKVELLQASFDFKMSIILALGH